MTAETAAPPPEAARPERRSARLGGVDFSPPPQGWPRGWPEEEQRPWVEHAGQGPLLARAKLQVRWVEAEQLAGEPVGLGEGPPPVEASERGGVLAVRSESFRLRLVPEVAGRWRVEGEAEGSPRGVERLMATVAALLAERAGGLAVHAASVLWEERAVAFVGPSGAGKSTASRRLRGARWLGHDRALLWPSRGGEGWLLWGLPWGTPNSPPEPAPRRWAPLGAVVRVVRGGRTHLSRLQPAEAALVARAATWRGVAGPAAELGRLGAVARLVERVPVGRLEHRLGEPFEAALRGLLRGEEAP